MTDVDQHYEEYISLGWTKFEHDEELEDWVKSSLPAACQALASNENQHWWRYQRTWFVGVNCLPNDGSGKVEGGQALQGNAARFLQEHLGGDLNALDRAQISVCYPGYPQASEHETAAASAYRLNRDAAHIDGLLKEGAASDRFVREPHDYILGIAMSEHSSDASPLVIWQGSHHLARAEFQAFFSRYDSQDWGSVDVTECYKQLRRSVFKQCERVEVALQPGQAVVAHRLLLHGTAPWGKDATADSNGRMLCFFRPSSISLAQWLDEAID